MRAWRQLLCKNVPWESILPLVLHFLSLRRTAFLSFDDSWACFFCPFLFVHGMSIVGIVPDCSFIEFANDYIIESESNFSPHLGSCFFEEFQKVFL